jgi:hypothetical protein
MHSESDYFKCIYMGRNVGGIVLDFEVCYLNLQGTPLCRVLPEKQIFAQLV